MVADRLLEPPRVQPPILGVYACDRNRAAGDRPDQLGLVAPVHVVDAQPVERGRVAGARDEIEEPGARTHDQRLLPERGRELRRALLPVTERMRFEESAVEAGKGGPDPLAAYDRSQRVPERHGEAEPEPGHCEELDGAGPAPAACAPAEVPGGDEEDDDRRHEVDDVARIRTREGGGERRGGETSRDGEYAALLAIRTPHGDRQERDGEEREQERLAFEEEAPRVSRREEPASGSGQGPEPFEV
jgi:hypothetical protein